MTWILPRQLHTLASALDTEALNLGYEESCRVCAQSLFVRSKPSLSRTWLQKWRRDSWTRHLYGRILRPSLGQRFTAEWTSSLAVIPASPSAQQGSGQERKTLATCGRGSQLEFLPCSPASASSRTSTGTSRWDSPQSSAIWKSLVTQRRGEYSVRLNAALRTNESVSSSWPTASTRDWKDSPGMALESTDRDGSHRDRADQLARAVYKYGQPDPANSSADGSRQESSLPWPTPQAFDAVNANTPQTWMDRQKRNSNMSRASRPTALSIAIQMPCLQTAAASTEARQQKGETLNPRWVCTLMNVPVHWVKP